MAEKRLKIVFLNIFQERVQRGSEVFVSELAKRLEKRHQLILISGNHSKTIRWPILWRFSLDPTGIAVLIFTCKNIGRIWRERPDIIVPLNGGWQVLIVRLLTWVYGGKMVISGQSGIGWDDRVNLWSFPNCFVGISSRAFKWAKKFNPLVKNVYIPNGVDTQKFKPHGSKLKTKLKRPLVLCVGALVPSKKIELVMEAVAGLENTDLLVVGKGVLEEKIKKLGQDLLRERFQLISCEHHQMPEVYRAADLFALVSSEREAFGIVFVEALASNLPLVAREDDQRKEIVGEAGILVANPEDPEELGRAIQEALETNWGDKPRRQAEKFSWDKIAQEYEKLFLDLSK